MDRILDLDQQPPYVEVYSDAPLMCASLVNTRRAMAGSSPSEQVHWCHGVQCAMDDIASRLGLYKIKILSNGSQICLFAISPDMPSRQQAEVMLHAAEQLRDTLSQVSLPGGDRLAAQVTLHAGKYAGAVVGRSAWTYDLFGEDVQLLLDMDRANSPNRIQVSDAAMALLSSRPGAFTPVCKVSGHGRQIQMNAWTPEVPSSSTGQSQQLQPGVPGGNQQREAQPAAEGSSRLPCPQQEPQQQQQQQCSQPAPHLHQQQQSPPQQQPPELRAAIAAAQSAAKSTKWPATSTAAVQDPAASGAMQQDLRFAEPVLESAYMETQRQPLANMDLLFILLNLAVMACCLWDSSQVAAHGSAGVLWHALLSAWGQWLLLPVAAVWLVASPASYGRWREPLWVVHRVLSALHVASQVLVSGLQHKALLAATAAAASTAGGAPVAAAVAAGTALSRGALGLHKGRALALFAESLGLKVRFHVHMLTSTCTCALLSLSTLWYWSSTSEQQSTLLELPLWDLLQHLLLGWAAPTVLMYVWELDDRARFLDLLQQQRNKAAEPLDAKCKDV